MTSDRGSRFRWSKVVAFVLGLVPFAWLAYRFATDQLSVNPLDDITDETGTWTLRFILITLAITPLRDLTGWSRLSTYRRMAGLYAFFYGSLHFLAYLSFDKFFDWAEILPDLASRRFIVAGFAAWLLMLPLAITSPTFVTRWMGGKAWKRLHRAVYVVAILGVVHYLWLVKFDIQRPLIYGALVIALLGYRVWAWWKRRSVGTSAHAR
ncbi:MAG: sulfoxide reductase heme-binding subunit YedZ [Bacteroidetes bacterium]|jgi:sulfoxide reductase heme-binding subunit YedZ|nr:sulfoxide reductase heme-binding subunit YedZ [Bacteroidota bacterium]